jgi:hypothetical protein
MFSTLLRLIAAVAAAVTLLAVPASAGAASAPGGSATQSPAPASVYRPAAVAQLPPKKPATAARTAATPATWGVTLTVDKSKLWPTQYATLTATANGDVAGTPYYIMIYQVTGAREPIKWCPFGTTCSVSLTSATPDDIEYEAEIATTPTLTYPPGGTIATSTLQEVQWWSAAVSLVAQPSTTAPGQPVVLTANAPGATSSLAPGPWPFFIEIYDATTGTPLAECPQGSCSYTVTQDTATTHRYVAYTVPYSLTFPPSNIQTISPSAWATWSPTGWTVSLGQNSDSSLTATVNHDVLPTPYWIEIYLEQDNADGTTATGTRVANCASGTTCTVSRSLLSPNNTAVAFVSDSTTSFPPTGIQAVTTFPSICLPEITLPYPPCGGS